MRIPVTVNGILAHVALDPKFYCDCAEWAGDDFCEHAIAIFNSDCKLTAEQGNLAHDALQQVGAVAPTAGYLIKQFPPGKERELGREVDVRSAKKDLWRLLSAAGLWAKQNPSLK